MMIGKISPDLLLFIAHYRDLGFRTKTEMANAAFLELKRKLDREKRDRFRNEVIEEYAHVKADHHLKEIEGEDFED